MGFLTGAGLTEAICKVTADPPVALAVAFWGNDALELLALPADLKGYRIACDAFSGACNPKAMAKLFERHAEVRDIPGLHAKVYHSPSCMVVTSANASTNGLGEDSTDLGLEAGMFVRRQGALTDALKWFDKIFARGRLIDKDDLPELRRLWKKRRKDRPMRTTLAEAILLNSANLADRGLKAYIYTSQEPAKAVQKRYEASPYFEPGAEEENNFPFFWDEIPGCGSGDELLCFEVDGSKVTYRNVWRVLGVIEDKDPFIYPALQIDKALGSQLGNMKTVAQRIAAALKAGRIKQDVAPITLAMLAKALSEPA